MAKNTSARAEHRSNALWGAGGRPGDSRANALWGSGGRPGDSRTNALWGKGGRGMILASAFVLAMVVPMAATGKDKEGQGGKAETAYVDGVLLSAAKASPDQTFDVVVQGAKGKRASDVSNVVSSVASSGSGKPGKLSKAFSHLPMASAQLTGAQILDLAQRPKDVLAITRDVPVRASNLGPITSKEKWVYATQTPKGWKELRQGAKPPTIAIVDSGIDKRRVAEFGARVIGSVNLYTGTNANSPGDGRGHGTMVAGMAASQALGASGVAANANLLSVDVIDDLGMAKTSDVIAAADWLLQNRALYNIRVANFSLHTAVPTTFMFDPLNRAVQQLWFSGVVVVAAAGNYGTDGTPSGVVAAPGNDPWVITVGALDINKSLSSSDDFLAPWSAYGYTPDGFWKPDLSAPGRYLVVPVPSDSSMYKERPDKIVRSGYMQMSGTSFSAPIVAGSAAVILAEKPTWTPDQVKGALMLSASATSVTNRSAGVGALDLAKALAISDPPNPNAALRTYVLADSTAGSGMSFDAASWSSAAQSDASWSSASWSSASWSSASWSSASWSSASWSSASWSSASWSSASWSSASWSSDAQADNAEAEQTAASDEHVATEDEITAACEALGLGTESVTLDDGSSLTQCALVDETTLTSTTSLTGALG
jgi:serine protease AprX